MDENLTFKAGEAGEITGVPPLMQRDWRRRGVVPAFDGDRASFPLREVCRFRLIRAYSDIGCALKDAANFADAFCSNLAEAVFARLRSIEEPFAHIAVATFYEGEAPTFVCVGYGEPPIPGITAPHNASLVLRNQLVLNLAPLADEMIDKMDLVGADRRIEALDEEMAKRGL